MKIIVREAPVANIVSINQAVREMGSNPEACIGFYAKRDPSQKGYVTMTDFESGVYRLAAKERVSVGNCYKKNNKDFPSLTSALFFLTDTPAVQFEVILFNSESELWAWLGED
jgi:hypothetical protein